MKRIKFIGPLIVLLFVLIAANRIESKQLAYDCVPDEKTAIAVGEALLKSKFGDLEAYQPFTAKLEDNKVWVVKGTISISKDSIVFKKGGVPYIKFQKNDCKVLTIYKTK